MFVHRVLEKLKQMKDYRSSWLLGWHQFVFGVSLWLISYFLYMDFSVDNYFTVLERSVFKAHKITFYLNMLLMVILSPFIQIERRLEVKYSENRAPINIKLVVVSSIITLKRIYHVLRVVVLIRYAPVCFWSNGLWAEMIFLFVPATDMFLNEISMYFYSAFATERLWAIDASMMIDIVPDDFLPRRKHFFNYLIYNRRTTHSILVMPLAGFAKELTRKQAFAVLMDRVPFEKIENDIELPTWIYDALTKYH